MASYSSFGNSDSSSAVYKNLCLLSAVFAFSVGLTVGILIPLVYLNAPSTSSRNYTSSTPLSLPRLVPINSTNGNTNAMRYPTVSFVKGRAEAAAHSDLLDDGVYWGKKVELALPQGYQQHKHTAWQAYVKKAVAVKMEPGCGRMQNRLVTFEDGAKGCVRYRQNTDQIQGELFSFYLAKILQLPNLAPSAVSVVDLAQPLWKNLRSEIAAAQWNSNRPIVLTQYIPNLNAASIPEVFKPAERHLNKFDVVNASRSDDLVELAQWSDLIVFDYLTANLDRIVNNLYNYQWNSNIMDAPAHNLAKKSDDDLLVFLDNESGLLHGYRLLKKYEIYHSVLLENLCVFRRRTADAIRRLKGGGDVGTLLRAMFDSENGDGVKDILPTIPDKSVKILNDRINRVYDQIQKCQAMFSDDFL
ncbi:hypothetical protein NQ315_000332 [Exocentrus adspersus]|uniref:Uncharacterized protein n=1 Tax=Exocentrus adspersus TaxID=1586481 RepID=A0AAV8VRM7_9CUCU|nr:hypothetical protein NQ315_000332 [Exocentrus adspersus]